MSASTRRVPLSSNQNVANSPVRNSSSALATAFSKQRHQKRAYASLQREEPYGQPPPAKKQMLNDGTEKASKSPVRQVRVPRREPTRQYKEGNVSQEKVSKSQQEEIGRARVQQWKQVTRRNFPNYVFYFESVLNEQRARIVKQLAHLGAREEKFFSKNITHVITTRPIPSEKPAPVRHDAADQASHSIHDQRGPHEMPKTIDPSLLSRDTNVKDVRRRLFESATRKLSVPVSTEDNILRQPTSGRNTDILVRAQEMNKKIWPFAKLVRVLETLNDPDPFRTAAAPKATEEANLAQLLNKERTCGPSDRDPTVATRELVFFKGPYIYIYDIEGKQKPIMIREYAKVADKKDGDWPQFRTTSSGRCPFIEEEVSHDRKRQAEKQAREKELEKQRQQAAVVEPAPKPKPSVVPAAGAKRSLTEMEHGHNTRAASARVPDVFDLAKAANPPNLEFARPQNAFTSRARSARLFAGEPVASGLQPSNITSAIRSQMISSASGILGAKAGTSKELHGLQRQVLKKNNATSTNPTSQDLSSRRLAEMSLDNGTVQRSASLGVNSRKLAQIEEERPKEHKRTKSVPAVAAAKAKKRELKPGYCENCQDKYEDFDEHIVSRKHRKFAEDDENWTQLDALLGQLERHPKYSDDLGEESGDW